MPGGVKRQRAKNKFIIIISWCIIVQRFNLEDMLTSLDSLSLT